MPIKKSKREKSEKPFMVQVKSNSKPPVLTTLTDDPLLQFWQSLVMPAVSIPEEFSAEQKELIKLYDQSGSRFFDLFLPCIRQQYYLRRHSSSVEHEFFDKRKIQNLYSSLQNFYRQYYSEPGELQDPFINQSTITAAQLKEYKEERGKKDYDCEKEFEKWCKVHQDLLRPDSESVEKFNSLFAPLRKQAGSAPEVKQNTSSVTRSESAPKVKSKSSSKVRSEVATKVRSKPTPKVQDDSEDSENSDESEEEEEESEESEENEGDEESDSSNSSGPCESPSERTALQLSQNTKAISIIGKSLRKFMDLLEDLEEDLKKESVDIGAKGPSTKGQVSPSGGRKKVRKGPSVSKKKVPEVAKKVAPRIASSKSSTTKKRKVPTKTNKETTSGPSTKVSKLSAVTPTRRSNRVGSSSLNPLTIDDDAVNIDDDGSRTEEYEPEPGLVSETLKDPTPKVDTESKETTDVAEDAEGTTENKDSTTDK